MTKLTTADIHKIAELAQLTVTEDKLPSLIKDLDNILNLVEKMDGAPTANIFPLAHAVHASQPLRSDEITEINQREILQRNAPQVEAGLYIVPQFIETAE